MAGYMRSSVFWLECLAVVRKVAGSSPTQVNDWKTSSEWVPD